MPGPVPKRTTERRRRNKPDTAPKSIKIEGSPVPAPDTPDGLHPIAARWFGSLRDSGQARFYEPSDWLAAEYVAWAMSKSLRQRKFSAVAFASVWSAMTDLLTTEGSRRKARVEVERETAEPESAGVTALADYRERLAK